MRLEVNQMRCRQRRLSSAQVKGDTHKRGAIADVIGAALPATGTVSAVATGSAGDCTCCAHRFRARTWQPSDRASPPGGFRLAWWTLTA
jgi:hypothetical protein